MENPPPPSSTMLHIEFNSALLFHRKHTNPQQISRIQLSSNGWRQKNHKTVEEFKTMVISSNPLAPELHISSHQQPYPSIPFSTNPNNVILPINRRHLLASLSVAVAPFFTSQPPDAGARGLFQMPPARLTNRYWGRTPELFIFWGLVSLGRLRKSRKRKENWNFLVVSVVGFWFFQETRTLYQLYSRVL